MFDAVSFLEDHGISYSTEGEKNVSKGWIGIQCPFCDDSSNHGGFNLSNGRYTCWKCGSHSTWEIVKAFTHGEDIKTVIASYDAISLWEEEKRETLQNKDEIEIPGKDLTVLGRTYLENRGFDCEYIIGKYKIREGVPMTAYEYRLIIPIYYKYKPISFQTRRLLKNDPQRYKNCPIEKEAIHSKNTIYNFDNCNKKAAIGVEGVPSVWRIGDDSFATFGTSFQLPQLQMIKNKFQTVYWLYDPEKEAQQKARKASQLISSIGVNVEIIEIEGYSDPDKMKEDDITYLRRELHLY